MSTSFEPNDELRRLWQTQDRTRPEKEVKEIMELVETRASTFDRKIFWRNAREYVAGAVVSVLFGFMAYHARTPLERIGFAIVSASGVWIILFMWLMQRSAPSPALESTAEEYKKSLIQKYDRQILLTGTAWAWYVLPPFTGVLVATFGNDHAPPGLKFIMAGVVAAVGVGVAVLNRVASKRLGEQKRELERLMDSAG